MWSLVQSLCTVLHGNVHCTHPFILLRPLHAAVLTPNCSFVTVPPIFLPGGAGSSRGTDGGAASGVVNGPLGAGFVTPARDGVRSDSVESPPQPGTVHDADVDLAAPELALHDVRLNRVVLM